MGYRIVVPERISIKTISKLNRELTQALADTKTRCIILSGQNDVFCEGLDFANLVPRQDDEIFSTIKMFAQCLLTLRMSPKPTIVVINGIARGGGVGFVAACDVAITSDASVFSIPEVLFGILPAVIYPFLLERISNKKCQLWALTGQSKSAEEALVSGLVDEVVAENKLEAVAACWVRTLSRGQSKTVVALKHLDALANDRQEAIERGIALTSGALQNAEVRAALEEFDKTGLPPWENRT